jgi:hypothetical protein
MSACWKELAYLAVLLDALTPAQTQQIVLPHQPQSRVCGSPQTLSRRSWAASRR